MVLGLAAMVDLVGQPPHAPVGVALQRGVAGLDLALDPLEDSRAGVLGRLGIEQHHQVIAWLGRHGACTRAGPRAAVDYISALQAVWAAGGRIPPSRRLVGYGPACWSAAQIPGGLLQRIRWANVARLLFVVAIAAVLVDGLPTLGGGARPAPELGLPDSVLRPPATAATPTAGASARRPATHGGTGDSSEAGSRGGSRRRRSERPRPAPRAAGPPTASVAPGAAYVAPPAASAPAVGEFGP